MAPCGFTETLTHVTHSCSCLIFTNLCIEECKDYCFHLIEDDKVIGSWGVGREL